MCLEYLPRGSCEVTHVSGNVTSQDCEMPDCNCQTSAPLVRQASVADWEVREDIETAGSSGKTVSLETPAPVTAK